MRRPGTAVAAVLGATVLAGAVVLLRSEVPPAAGPTDEATVSVAPEPPLLPVRLPASRTSWQSYGPFDGIVTAQTDRERIVYAQADRPVRVTVVARASRRPVAEYPPPGRLAVIEQRWLLHTGAVFFLERDLDTGSGQLVRLDPSTATVTALALKTVAGPALDHTPLIGVGDEVLLIGETEDGRPACIVAVRPATGADRPVLCVELDVQEVWLARYGDEEALVGFGVSPPGCSDWLRLLTDGRLRPIRLDGTCDALSLAVVGDWRISAPSRSILELDTPAGPVVARRDGRELRLDTAGGGAVSCGRHVYWTAPSGGSAVLRRWRPGMEWVEQVHEVGTAQHIALPACRDGVLTVPTYSTVGFAESIVQVLDQP